jgi:hypothetical protein
MVIGVLWEQAGYGSPEIIRAGGPGKRPHKNPNRFAEDFVLRRGFQLLLVACLATGTLWAASDPLVGKWKLDPSKSKRTDLMRVARAGANKYTLIFNSGGVETAARSS